MSLSPVGLLAHVSCRSIWMKRLIFNEHQDIPFLGPEHTVSLSFHAWRHIWVTAFGHQYKTLKSLKNTAAILLSWSSSVSVSDSYTRQMCSLMSTPAPASVFDIHLKECVQKNCTVFERFLSFVIVCVLQEVCFREKRLVSAAAAHLSCCFWVSRPC